MPAESTVHAFAKPVRYLFYRVLSWKLHDEHDLTPALTASLSTLLFLSINVMTVAMLWNWWLGREPLPTLPANRVALCLVVIASGAVVHRVLKRLWVDNGRYNKLVQEFETSDDTRRRVNSVILWSYIIGTAITPICVAILWRNLAA
jgi:hypothetical protein